MHSPGGNIGQGQGRQAEIEGVAVEKAGERGRDHRGDAEVAQRLRGLLARGAGAEVASADDHVARPHLGGEARLDQLQAMPRDLLDAEFHVLARREHVGLEVVAEDPRAAAHATNSLGSQIRPATAEAATVYGEPR